MCHSVHDCCTLWGGLSGKERCEQNFGLGALLAARRFIVGGSAFWAEDAVHSEMPMKGSRLGSLEYFLFYAAEHGNQLLNHLLSV